jgi:hypothetical protein
MPQRRLSSLVVVFALLVPAAAGAAGPFRDVPPGELAERGSSAAAPAQHFRALAVDLDALSVLLERAPEEGSADAAATPLVLALPYPEGGERRFAVVASPVMEPALQARYPEIRTFAAQGIDEPAASARLSLTPFGFHAQVLSPGGTVLIDPWRAGGPGLAIAYRKRDARRAPGTAFTCGVTTREQEEASAALDQSRAALGDGLTASSGTQLRTYRLALAGTGEYTTAVCAPDPAAVGCGLAAMAVSMNRVNGIYERDVAIRMVMVANNDLVVYTNGGADPYTNGSGGTMLGQNQSNLDMVIGSANYDIGHVFSTGGGGIAQLNVPCTGSKARGVTGQANPVGDPFDVDYVAHEMGHQFGGAHTFNGTTGNCGGNRSGSSAYEPGSGSTIMAYAGICDAEDLQPHSDDTFHPRSFDQIVAFSTGATGSSCPVITATGNTPPAVEAGPAFSIPRLTPFTLTGSATDADGDGLTYMWEEMDLGSASPPNDDVAAVRPIFRSFVPLPVPSRDLPRRSDVLANVATLGEAMSTRNRTMTFRLTARDNRAGGGGVANDSTTVTVVAAAGPFVVTAPNTAVTWSGLGSQEVTWNVAGTSVAPISCASVDVHLSTDGGNSFPHVLATGTPNDGAEIVTVPDLPTTQARVRVGCTGNVFWDVSNLSYTIEASIPPVPSDFYTVAPCRVVDTRLPDGPLGGPALATGVTRAFAVAGNCGVPPGAEAIALNVTVIAPAGGGNVVVFPAGLAPPAVSTVSFAAGQARANNTLVGLDGPDAGSLSALATLAGGGTVHLLVDVTGYFD